MLGLYLNNGSANKGEEAGGKGEGVRGRKVLYVKVLPEVIHPTAPLSRSTTFSGELTLFWLRHA